MVIEAPLRSGSLITARLANEIGRTVFAIPGRVGDACSEGCNKLIRDGAVMVTTVDDILQELNPELPMPELPCRASAKKRSRREPAPGDLFAAERPAATAMEAVGERNKNYSEEIVENDPPPPRPRLSDEQSRILGMIGTEWRTIDDVIVDAELPPGKVTACLAVLRLQRLVEQGPGQTYRRK